MRPTAFVLAGILAGCSTPPPAEPDLPASLHAHLEVGKHLASRHGGTVVACPVPGIDNGAVVSFEAGADLWWPVQDGWVLGLAQAMDGDRILGDQRVVWHAMAAGGITTCELQPVEYATLVIRPLMEDGSAAPRVDHAGRSGSVTGCHSGRTEADWQPDGTLVHRVEVREGGSCRLTAYWHGELLGRGVGGEPAIRVLELTDLVAGEERVLELVVDGRGAAVAMGDSEGWLSRASSLLGRRPDRDRRWTDEELVRWLKSASVRKELSQQARGVARERAEQMEAFHQRGRAQFQAVQRLGESPKAVRLAMDEHLDLSTAWYVARGEREKLRVAGASIEEMAKATETLDASEKALCDWLEDRDRRLAFGVPPACETRWDDAGDPM